MTIGNRLRKARMAKGYSQEYVAIQLGITQGGYRKMESDETKLRVDTLLLLADLLEADAGRLLYGPLTKAASGKGNTRQINEMGVDLTNSVPYASGLEQGLLKELLESKEAHLVTQQKLLRQYEEEISTLRFRVAQLSVNVASLHAGNEQLHH